MKLIRLSDNKEFIKEYYEYLKTFFEIVDDKNFAKIKRILKQIDTFNFEISHPLKTISFGSTIGTKDLNGATYVLPVSS